TGSHSVPPADELVQTHFGGGFSQPACLVLEDADWTPLTSQNQLRCSVAIQVAPNRATYQTNLFKNARVLDVRYPTLPVVTKDTGGSRLRISPWIDSSADEQIHLAIAIDVGESQRPNAGLPGGNNVLNHGLGQAELLNRASNSAAILVIRRTGQQQGFGFRLAPNQN